MKKSLLSAGLSLLAAAPLLAQTMEHHHGQMAPPPQTRADVEAKVKAQFADIDANKDGFITRDEIAAHREAKMKATQDKMFDKMDANKDGAISRDEFAAHHAAMKQKMAAMAGGPAMAMMHDGPDGQAGAIMVPGLDDTMAKAGGAGMDRRIIIRKRIIGAPMAGMIGERMFDTADTNKDGKLSQDEVRTAALARFDRLDRNKDGTISPDERQAAGGEMRMMWRQRMMRP